MGSDQANAKETPFVWKFVQTVVVHKHIRDHYRETTLKQKGILVWKSLYFFFLIGWGVGVVVMMMVSHISH